MILGKLACRCGCGYAPDMPQVKMALEIMDKLAPDGTNITVTSGARCKAHNLAVKGHKNSYHLYGLAFDVVSSLETIDLLNLVLSVNACQAACVGLYVGSKEFIHVDFRPYYHRFAVKNGVKVCYDELVKELELYG